MWEKLAKNLEDVGDMMRHVRISSETTSVMGTIKTSDFNSKKINKTG